MNKTISKIKLPAVFSDVKEYDEKIINKLLDYYDFLDLNQKDLEITEVELLKKLEDLREKYSNLTIEYSKLRKEYGVLFFENSELFRRNSMLALKLGKIQNKLNKIIGKNVESDGILKLDLEKEKIKRFYNRYLAKKETE